jgi:hypothetical protein
MIERFQGRELDEANGTSLTMSIIMAGAHEHTGTGRVAGLGLHGGAL